MKRLLAALAVLPLWAGSPDYSASSLLNAASNVAGPLAPNAIVSLYGRDLSWNTGSARGEDVRDGLLPTYLPGTGVVVYVNGFRAGLYYVSPTQINFLLPATIVPGRAYIAVIRDGVRGPEIQVNLSDVAPALFQLDPDCVVATRPDGTAIGRENPARPGEIVILYANGLGAVLPPLRERALAPAAAPITREAELEITLGGVPVPRDSLLYAGVAPGFAGLYQINLRIPAEAPDNPEIRIGFGSTVSRGGVRLLLRR
jgi:uncharacterized protein (TIGR03437 family)